MSRWRSIARSHWSRSSGAGSIIASAFSRCRGGVSQSSVALAERRLRHRDILPCTLASRRQRDDVGRRIDDALDLRGQRLERLQLLAVKFVPVVDAANAADDATETALGVVR